jgi:hypothetical protein
MDMSTQQLPTQEEILKRFEERREHDMFGFEVNEYARFMGYDQLKPYLRDGITKDNFEAPLELTREAILEIMKDYIDFAFDKAYGERGISANRSIMHYIAWTWLAGDYQFSKEIEDEYDRNYHSYGLPILVKICKYYGWEIPK